MVPATSPKIRLRVLQDNMSIRATISKRVDARYPSWHIRPWDGSSCSTNLEIFEFNWPLMSVDYSICEPGKVNETYFSDSDPERSGCPE